MVEALAGLAELVQLAELPVETLAGLVVVLTELSVGILVELIELAVMAGHPYSRHQVDRFA